MAETALTGNNLILTGFMGTGKSTIGQEVARRLDRPFIDMDLEIERRNQATVARIFAEKGETAFREMERDLCRELSARNGLVIATGGGALVDPANRDALAATGILICLNAHPETILSRIQTANAPERPLLQTEDPAAAVARLLILRREAYRAIPWQIDTTTLSIAEAVERVLSLAEIQTLPVTHSGAGYPIHIGTGLLARLGDALRAVGIPENSKVALVTNPVVEKYYAAPAESALRAAGLIPQRCLIPDGESAKTLETVGNLYSQFLTAGLDREGTVLALGGGVTGDIAGFAAATYLRGVRFVQVPTTLLAMTDSSVGGKTGVDLPQGKNLVGAFKPPELVLIDPAVLATLPIEEFRSGLAELIKHAVLGEPGLFAALEKRVGEPFPNSWELAQSLRVKIAVVEADPHEKGQRAVLNLGHTLGHALEKISQYTIRHGEGVAIGMVAAARIATILGHAEGTLAYRIENLLQAWGLPTTCPPYPAAKILAATAYDKKRHGNTIRWILPCAIGSPKIIETVPPETVLQVLQDMGAL